VAQSGGGWKLCLFQVRGRVGTRVLAPAGSPFRSKPGNTAGGTESLRAPKHRGGGRRGFLGRISGQEDLTGVFALYLFGRALGVEGPRNPPGARTFDRASFGPCFPTEDVEATVLVLCRDRSRVS